MPLAELPVGLGRFEFDCKLLRALPCMPGPSTMSPDPTLETFDRPCLAPTGPRAFRGGMPGVDSSSFSLFCVAAAPMSWSSLGLFRGAACCPLSAPAAVFSLRPASTEAKLPPPPPPCCAPGSTSPTLGRRCLPAAPPIAAAAPEAGAPPEAAPPPREPATPPEPTTGAPTRYCTAPNADEPPPNADDEPNADEAAAKDDAGDEGDIE